MKHKHNIDRLFSDSLRDLNIEPAAENWEVISEKLKHKKRRVLPFWWSIAASFVLFLGLGAYFLNPFENSHFKKHVSTDPVPFNEESVTSKDNILPAKDLNSNTKTRNTIVYNKNVLNQSIKNQVVNGGFVTKNKALKTNSILLQNDSSKRTLFRNNSEEESSQTSTAFEGSAVKQPVTKLDMITAIISESALSLKSELNVVPSTFSKSLAKMYPKASLNKLATAQNEQKPKKQALTNRWWVGPVMAPLIASAVGNDSPIDPKFTNNAKQFKSVTAFGIQAQYAVTSQFSIRSGVQTMAFEYVTSDIVFWEGYQNTHLENMHSSDQLYIQIESGLSNNQALNKNSNNGIDGQLHQRSSYVEWPVEGIMQWKLNRWFFECSGGMSTLFLQENRIYLTSTGISMTVGEASNLSRVHYSANIGLGAGYYLKNDLSVGVSPSFKYQINTYSNNTGNFTPYVLGFYGGIKYRF